MGSDDESKLAAPKLFGRKKRSSTPPAGQPVPDAPDAEEAAPPLTPAEPEQPEPEQPEPEQPGAETPAPEGTLVDLAPVEETDPIPPGAEAEPEPQREPAPEPVAVPERVEPAPAREPKTTKPPKPPKQPKPAKQPKAAKPPREPRSLPALSGMQAAALIGLVVGIFLLLATYGALNLCSTVRGTSTCGGGAGFPLLLAIGIVAVVGGGTLLRLFHVSSPMGDSFLAVALVAVVTVLFLHNHYDAWWMAIVVPVLTLLAFLLAHWVSVTYIDPVDE